MIHGQFVTSDFDGCHNCHQMHYELTDRHHVCGLNYRPVEPYNPPCLFFDRVLQGFGE